MEDCVRPERAEARLIEVTSEIRDGAQSPTAGLQVAAPSGTFTTEYCASSDSNSTYAELR